jgi:hypothetical protein
MVHVARVDLSERGIVLPSDRVGMVIAQPFLSLTSEPFRCVPTDKPQQLANLEKTFAVARSAPHHAPKTHFTILPEYSIPGLDGVALVQAELNDAQWPTGTIVIGGMDAVTKPEFQALANEPNTHLDRTNNNLDRIGQDEWINCGITWTKANSGLVERWLQPKLSPSWPEMAFKYQSMFRGNSIFAFTGMLQNGASYRFSSLVCFDWIAIIEGRPAWRWALEDLYAQVPPGGELPLSWFVVIQHNRQPSHESFLGPVGSFFDQTQLTTVRRERTCLVFANTAGKAHPGRAQFFGGTSLIFTQRTPFKEAASLPTVSKGGAPFRPNGLLTAYRDVFFREKGACIHSFVQINPDSVLAGPEGRTFAVDRAFVFPFADAADPRTPSNLVPACIKWMNDELDEVPSLRAMHPDAALGAQADLAHQDSIRAVRALSPLASTKIIRLAAANNSLDAEDQRLENADAWDRKESDALRHVLYTVNLMHICFGATIAAEDRAQATVTIGDRILDLLAIRGDRHDQCRKHAQNFLAGARRKVLFVSRDQENSALSRRSRSILRPETALGQENKITDPESAIIHIDYQTLLHAFQDAQTPVAMAGAINAELAA